MNMLLNLILEYKFLNAYGREKYFEQNLWRQHETTFVMVSTFCCPSVFKTNRVGIYSKCICMRCRSVILEFWWQ